MRISDWSSDVCSSDLRFHRALYGAEQLSKESIEAAAKQAGLDPATVKAAQSASDINAEIDNNVRLAQALQATGTPTWGVDDQVLSGAVGYDALKAGIENARAGRSRKRVVEGKGVSGRGDIRG